MRRRRAELGLAEVPLAVTASRSLELPVDAPLFQDPESRIVVLTNSDREPPPCAAQLIVERIPGDELDLAAGMERAAHACTACARCCTRAAPRCSRRCWRRASWTSCSCPSRRCWSGGGEPSVVEGTAFEQPRRLELVSVLEHESFLYLRYARRSRSCGSHDGAARRIGGLSAESRL